MHNANVQPRHCGNNTRHTHAASDDTPCYDQLPERDMPEFRIKVSVDIVFYAKDELEFNNLSNDVNDDTIENSLAYSFPNAQCAVATIESAGVVAEPS